MANLNGRLDNILKAYAAKCSAALPYCTKEEVFSLQGLVRIHGRGVAPFLPEFIAIINAATARTTPRKR